MLVLLTGSGIKNVGDFLIYSKAKEMLEYCLPDEELITIFRRESLDKHIGIVNSSRGVVLCGGPGYRRNFYPKTFALTKSIEDVAVPIIPFGLGWVGEPFEEPDSFRFDTRSLDCLKKIHDKILVSSVRDKLSKQVLTANGIINVSNTGCPATYDFNRVNTEFIPPGSLGKIVVTAPAKARSFVPAEKLVVQIAKMFPSAHRVLSFHRGIYKDEHTSLIEEANNVSLKNVAEENGFAIVDSSYSVNKINFYEGFDLHVGFRVHGHLNFLSLRKPSILISEDGRGIGQDMNFNTSPIISTDSNMIDIVCDRVSSHVLNKFYDFNDVFCCIDNMFVSMQEFILGWGV